jgi:crotonobetainyl-CoA:carnitine CoA-transferase CaiB-like acyl-CoA transferase
VLACLRARVPVAEISDPWMVLADDQLRATSFFAAQEHRICGSISYPGLPLRAQLDGQPLPTGHCGPAPCWAQHDDQLSRLTGIDARRISRLSAAAVLGRKPTSLGAM